MSTPPPAALIGSPTHKPLGYAVVRTCALIGLDAHLITVEVSVSRGPPSFQMVGLPEASVREARVRITSALSFLGVLVDEYAITVNLAPAELPKSGATLDLALAAAVLAAIGKIPASCLDAWLLLGELSLDGALHPMKGVLAPAERTLFKPSGRTGHLGDMSQVRGQPGARRALEIGAAGQHNSPLIGPQTLRACPSDSLYTRRQPVHLGSHCGKPPNAQIFPAQEHDVFPDPSHGGVRNCGAERTLYSHHVSHLYAAR